LPQTITKNKQVTQLVYLLVGAIAIYGIAIAISGGIGDTPFTFSDNTEFKKGFNSSPLTKVSQSWIGWEIQYTDGIKEVGRTGKNTNSIAPFDLLKSVGKTPREIQKAEFVVYTDFSNFGKDICFGTPSTTITQTVLVNGLEAKVPKQGVLYNEIDSRNILKGIGVTITPSFFQSQLAKVFPIKSGDIIEVRLDAHGRFDVTEIENGQCPLEFEKRHDGFVEDIYTKIVMQYNDPTMQENDEHIVIIDDNPTGVDGIVGICDRSKADCDENSADIDDFVSEVRTEEFVYNSFEFIMLVIIAIIVLVILISLAIGRQSGY